MGDHIKALTAKDAEYGFGQLIDLACAELTVNNGHGRRAGVAMVAEAGVRLLGESRSGSGSRQRAR